jgi:DNA-binding SARP family transcriptional activator
MQASPASPIQIFLLGRFEVARGECTLPAAAWSRRKAAALLQRLALERRLLKDQAIDFLWPDATLASGANNLYRTLHALRQTLNTALGSDAADTTFAFEDGVLSLHNSVWVDVEAFKELSSTPGKASHLQQALALYQGELLPDERYADWTLVPREALRRLRREAALTLAANQRETRDYAAAIALLTPLLAEDPADEPVHRDLMRTYALAGRRHDALRQYQTCVEVLASELDAPPEPETNALHIQILNGELSPPPARGAPAAWSPPAPISLEIERGALLAGREAELETLRAQMDVGWRGRGQTILLAGDTGVGKTRLAYEALRAAAAAGVTTLFGAAYEQEGQLPYQPFIEAFDRYLAERGSLDTGDGSAVGPRDNPITHSTGAGSGDLQREQWALFNAAASFLLDLAAEAPVVLLVDDLHAADQTTLHLFHYLARQTRAAPVILLATYRTDIAANPASPFGALLNALYREHLSQTLNLAPLDTGAVGEILADILGGEAVPELTQAVFEIAEGNPFHVQEIAHALLKSGDVEERVGHWQLKPGAELGVPTGLGGLLRERVQRLGPLVESTLVAAAVIGREFNFEVLRGTIPLSDGELFDALDAALAGYLLEETESGYRFRHSLIRRVLYDSLSRVRRARLHTRAAEAIETTYARAPEGLRPHVQALAYHYDLSDRRDRALDYLLQAGERAAGVYAFEVAVDYFERALALMDALGMRDPGQRWKLLESLGWWGMILADTPRVVAHFEQAIALPPTDDWRSARRDRVRLHCGCALALLTAGQTAAAEAHLRAGLAEVDENEHAAEYADLLYNLAQLHWHRNEYQDAFDVAQRGLAVAERLNHPEAIARAFEMLALACHSLGEWQTGIGYEEQRAALTGPGLDVTDAFDVHL